MSDEMNAQWFLRLRTNADEALRMKERARLILEQRPAERYDGLGHLLGKVLPAEPAPVERIAEALGIDAPLLAQLRASELDPVHMPPPILVVLGQILGLSEQSFLDLVWRDHERFAQLDEGIMSRGAAPGPDEFRIELREAWSRAAMDDPTEA